MKILQLNVWKALGAIVLMSFPSFSFISKEIPNEGKITIRFTGEEAFEGIFFSSGEFADNIPELRNREAFLTFKKEENKEERSHVIGDIKQELLKEDSNVFIQFQKDIASKDYERVRVAVSGMREKVLVVIKNKYGQLSKEDSNLLLPYCINFNLYSDLVIFWVVAEAQEEKIVALKEYTKLSDEQLVAAVVENI